MLKDRVAQQGEQLHQYEAVLRSYMAARVSEDPQVEFIPNQGNNSQASTSRQPEAEMPPPQSLSSMVPV